MEPINSNPAVIQEVREETTSQKVIRLGQMRDKSGPQMFKRIGLAYEIFRDKEWIRVEFNGDVDKASEVLTSDFLGDLCGSGMGLSELFLLYREFPSLDDWKRCKFSTRRLYAEYEIRKEQRQEEAGDKDKEKREYRRATIKELESEMQRRKEIEYNLSKTELVLVTREQENDRLRQENEKLKHEVAVLMGRIVELEKLMSTR